MIGVLASFAVLASALPAAAALTPVDPIEGVFRLSGCDGFDCVSGLVRVLPGGEGLQGVAFSDVEFTGQCTHEQGTSFWSVFPSGDGNYQGTHSGFVLKDGECVLTPAWLATWTPYPEDAEAPSKYEFCAKLNSNIAKEWQCWDMEREGLSYGTRAFKASVEMRAKGDFTHKHLVPKGYRKTKAEAAVPRFDMMWHPKRNAFGADYSLLGLLDGGGSMTLTDVIGKGANRRRERTVLDLGVADRGSSFPLPDENGFVDEVALLFWVSVVRSQIPGCKDGATGFVSFTLNRQGEFVYVHIPDCRVYAFSNGQPTDASVVDVRAFTLG